MAGLGFGAGAETGVGVYTREIDLTTSVVSGTSSVNGFAGIFNWGPVNVPTLINSEDNLVQTFGKPSNNNPETWFTASSFLAYADGLLVNRVADSGNTVLSAVANSTTVTSVGAHTIDNDDDYNTSAPSFEAGVNWIARYPGALGNSLQISICSTRDQYSSTINLANVGGNTAFNSASTAALFTVGSNTVSITLANTAALSANTPLPLATTIADNLIVGDIVTIGNTSVGTQDLRITTVPTILVSNTLGANTGGAVITFSVDQPVKIASTFTTTSVARKWQYATLVGAPVTTYSVRELGNADAVDGMSVVVVDAGGKFTSRPGAILEVFENVSRATDATLIDGTNNFYKTAINDRSRYVWVGSAVPGITSNTQINISSAASTTPYTKRFALGADGADEASTPLAPLLRGFDVFADANRFNISGIITGKARGGTYGEQLFNYVIDNVSLVRNDVVTYGSPAKASVTTTDPTTAVTDFRSVVRKTSYGFMDSGYKYMYDKYNDLFRMVPLNGDVAGLSARTDITNDPWFAFAGYTRGQLKNVVRLVYSPTPAQQKVLFDNDVNPVVTVRGDGTFLFGDKTLLGEQSAFNQIGTRKMLNILKKAIAEYAKSLLFEFNDEFTQARFKNNVDPYLRDVKGRKGLTDYRVVCDETNNTQQIKNSNQFVGDIFFVPARSIRAIYLNFVGVNSTVTFTETLA